MRLRFSLWRARRAGRLLSKHSPLVVWTEWNGVVIAAHYHGKRVN